MTLDEYLLIRFIRSNHPKYRKTHNQIVDELDEETKLIFKGDCKYKLEFKDFFIPLQECIERDSKRPNPIGEEVIKKTYEKYKDILEG